MDTTGLIFVVVIVAWLVYLIPHHMVRRTVAKDAEEVGEAALAEPSITLHRGVPVSAVEDEAVSYDQHDLTDVFLNLPLATDLTRRSLRRDLARMSQRAAQARRRALIALVLLALAALVVAVIGLTGWWVPAVGGAAGVVGLVLSRRNVVRVNRLLDRYRAAIEQGSDEATVAIVAPPLAEGVEPSVRRRAADGPVEEIANQPELSLWEPLPIPAATYVSKPLAPRTTRTIDLAGPAPAQPFPVVTADGPGEDTDELSTAI